MSSLVSNVSKVDTVVTDAVSHSHGYSSYTAPLLPVHPVIPAPVEHHLPVVPVRRYLAGQGDQKTPFFLQGNASRAYPDLPPSYEAATKSGFASHRTNTDWLDGLSDNERRGLTIAAVTVFAAGSIAAAATAATFASEHNNRQEQANPQPRAGDEIRRDDNLFSTPSATSSTVAASDDLLNRSLLELSSEKSSASDVENAASASSRPSLLQRLLG